MNRCEIQAALLEQIQGMEVIDCHEHLAPEEVRLSQPVDVMNLFCHYTRLDLQTSGMSEATFNSLRDYRIPLETRWGMFRPYFEHIRYGSYARAAFLAAKELYGFEDISDDTYPALSAAMQERNQPGIYRWILREKCRIRVSLTQCGSTETKSDILVPLMPSQQLWLVGKWAEVQERARTWGRTVNTLDDYVELMEAGLAQWKAEGAVGIKMMTQPFGETSREAAAAAWEELRSGRLTDLPAVHPLNVYLLERLLERAGRQEMVVAVHAGMWGDFRQLDGTHMIPLFFKFPQTRFDLYHLSFPQVHEAVIIGKTFPNVYMNLCWTHIMSPTLAREGVRELLDFVPVNKVFGFGGDYFAFSVDKAIGHLRMAQENLAAVFAERVAEGLMSEEQALGVIRRWLWDNPIEAYRLELPPQQHNDS